MTFTYPAVSHVFQGPGFSGFRFFRVQVFRVRVQGPGPGSRVLVQGPGPGFRSSPLNSVCDSLSFTPLECYENSLNIYFSWKVFFVMIFFAQESSNGILFSKSSILKNPIQMWHSKNMKIFQYLKKKSNTDSLYDVNICLSYSTDGFYGFNFLHRTTNFRNDLSLT